MNSDDNSTSHSICQPVAMGNDVRVATNDNGSSPFLLDSVYGVALPTQGGVMRVACGARKVPGVHNSSNSYILVDPNVSHGDLLPLCSNPACAASGRRFRWCAICKVPCAKRNFSKRHAHGMPVPNNNTSGSSSTTPPPAAQQDTPLTWIDPPTPPSMDLNENKKRTFESINAATEATTSVTTATAINQLAPTEAPTVTNQLAPTQTLLSALPAAQETTVNVDLTPDEFRWLCVLRSRPQVDDTEAIQRWCQSLVEIPTDALRRNPPSANSRRVPSAADTLFENYRSAVQEGSGKPV